MPSVLLTGPISSIWKRPGAVFRAKNCDRLALETTTTTTTSTTTTTTSIKKIGLVPCCVRTVVSGVLSMRRCQFDYCRQVKAAKQCNAVLQQSAWPEQDCYRFCPVTLTQHPSFRWQPWVVTWRQQHKMDNQLRLFSQQNQV